VIGKNYISPHGGKGTGLKESQVTEGGNLVLQTKKSQRGGKGKTSKQCKQRVWGGGTTDRKYKRRMEAKTKGTVLSD